jgi:hypothetical protein
MNLNHRLGKLEERIQQLRKGAHAAELSDEERIARLTELFQQVQVQQQALERVLQLPQAALLTDVQVAQRCGGGVTAEMVGRRRGTLPPTPPDPSDDELVFRLRAFLERVRSGQAGPSTCPGATRPG